MKKLLELMILFCLCVGFAHAQSPQAVNFLPPTNYRSISPNFQNKGNELWFPSSNALVKLNMLNNVQTLYKPENSDMKGSCVTSIVLDSSGMIYGTSDKKGIFTFDGNHFTHYDTLVSGEPVLASYEATLDSNGNVYAIAYLDSALIDIVKFDGTTLSRLHIHIPAFTNATPTSNSLVVDKNNTLFYVLGDTTYMYAGNNWSSLVTPLNYYYKIVCDENKDAWLVPITFISSTNTYSFYKWGGNNWIAYNVTSSTVIPMVVQDVTVDANGDFWICGKDNIVKKTGNNLSVVNAPPINGAATQKMFSNFLAMPNGDFWCRFTSNLAFMPEDIIWHYNGNWNKVKAYHDFENDITTVQVDKWNRKWAVGHSGIYTLNGNIWEKIAFPFPYITCSNFANGLDFDVNGDLICLLADSNMFAGLPFRYDGFNWTLITNNFYALDLAVNDMGHIAAYNGAGIQYFDGAIWHSYPYQPASGVGTLDYNHILADNNNDFWLTTNIGELVKFDGSSFTIIATISFFGPFHDKGKDAMGNLWFADADSLHLYKFDGVNIIHYDSTNLPFSFSPSFSIFAGTTDLAGNIWISTSEGLGKFDGATWNIYTENNADFMSNEIGSISVDAANNLWLGDTRGVSIFNESGVSANFSQNIFPLFKGSVYFDVNSNGQKDVVDYNLSNQKVFVLPDSTIRFSNNLGKYQFVPDTGSYDLSALLYPNWYQTSTPIHHTLLATPQGADTLDFGIRDNGNMDSLELHFWGGGSQCNWSSYYFITYQNKGNVPLSGDIILTIDSLTTFLVSFPTGVALSPYVYSWHFQNLMPSQLKNINVIFQSPNWQSMGQSIIGNVQAIGTNFNETKSYSYIVTCAYDPNEKVSNPVGEHYLHKIKPDCPLEYLIRFQNTGNDVAFNIAIEDTISPYLDLNTLELLGSSHFVETKYKPNGAVRFEFPLIMLPDSNQNEPLSHGFVAYRIKPKANVPMPVIVKNTAFIYFDQNPAVVTNTTRDTITTFHTMGINAPTPQNELLISPNPFDNQTIVTYSNPYGEGYEVLIYDLSGKLLVRKMDNTGRFSIEKGNLQSGMYLLKVRGRREMSAKLVVQ